MDEQHNYNHYDIENILELKQTIENISKIKDSKILIIFDIDDTLIRPLVTTGSDTWFSFSLKSNSIYSVLKDLFYIYSILDFIPVEDNTVEIIKNVTEKSNVDSLCLTSRNTDFISHTIKHLRESGLGFMIKKNMIDIDCIDIDPEIESDKTIRYLDNICTASGHNKGYIIDKILEKNTRKYSHVIFIDDSLKNINDVSRYFRFEKYKNIKTSTFHYKFMEHHKNNYSLHNFIDDSKKVNELLFFKNKFNTDIIKR